jgi:hypothetical protein
MAGKRKLENAADEEATRLWASLTRVVALTPQGVEETPVHVATLKLDGCRVCLCSKAGVYCRIDALGRETIEDGSVQEDFILDVEEHDGTFWAFDALMVRGRDLRSLAFADRLRHLDPLLQSLTTLGKFRVKMKSYRSLRSGDAIHRLLLDAHSSAACDGIIFCDLTAVYETPPFKFKPHLTVDFCLESTSESSPGAFGLLTQVAGRLTPFKLHGKPCVVVVSSEERAALGLANVLRREDGIILECAIPKGRNGPWKAVRRRPDRRNPNCLRTVLDTLSMHQRGYDEAAFLHRLLPPLGTKSAFEAWRAVIRRQILWQEEGDRGGEVVEVHGEGHAGYEGSVRAEEVRLVLPLEGCIRVCAFFSLDDRETVAFLSVLKLWLTGSSRRSLELLLVTQSLHEGLSASDARYFGVFMDSSPETLLGLASTSFKLATVTSLLMGSPSDLFQLPPVLARLASTTWIFRVSSSEGGSLGRVTRRSGADAVDDAFALKA